MSQPFVSETTFHVRYAETDAQGFVHHASYIVYFEEGRSDYIRQRGRSYAEFEEKGYFLIVAELGVRYVKAARYDQRITVRAWIAERKSRSLTYNYEILDAETREVLVTGFTKHLCITRDGSIARIPDEWRSWAGDSAF
jgi:acyl-CoA thioester hydrolase